MPQKERWFRIPAGEASFSERASLLEAATAATLEEFDLESEDRKALLALRDALRDLIAPLETTSGLVDRLHYLVDAAGGRVEIQKRLNIFGDYDVRYSSGVRGPETLEIGEEEFDFDQLRVTGTDTVPVSRSLPLLTGELFEAHAGRLLRRLSVDGSDVVGSRRLEQASPGGGRRVDDWLATLRDGRPVPAEVKASMERSYLASAAEQLRHAVAEHGRALLVGVSYRERTVYVLYLRTPLSEQDLTDRLREMRAE